MTIKPDGHYNDLYLQQGGRCRWCKQVLPPNSLHRDHVLPRSKGYYILDYVENNTRKLANVVLSCRKCNSIKSDLSLDEFEADVRKRMAGGDFWRWKVMLESISEAKEQQLEELHIRMIESAKQYKIEYKSTQKERRRLKAKMKRERKRLLKLKLI